MKSLSGKVMLEKAVKGRNKIASRVISPDMSVEGAECWGC